MSNSESWFWILEDGTRFSAEQVEHKFDRIFKVMIKHKAFDAVKHEINERKKFPIRADDVLDLIEAVETVYDIEKCEVKLKNLSLFLNREELADALGKLEPREKEYIELSFVYGLNADEIADLFHVTRDYVYILRHRILEKLRNMIGDSHDRM